MVVGLLGVEPRRRRKNVRAHDLFLIFLNFSEHLGGTAHIALIDILRRQIEALFDENPLILTDR